MYRRRGLSNLLRMGHCAPAVMQTMLDLKDTKEEWLIRMTAGLPGGIGNTGYECGGITSPLIRFGLEHGLSAEADGGHEQFTLGFDPVLCRIPLISGPCQEDLVGAQGDLFVSGRGWRGPWSEPVHGIGQQTLASSTGSWSRDEVTSASSHGCLRGGEYTGWL